MRIDISQSLKAAKTEADFHTSGVAGILLQADIFPQFNISKQNPNAPRKGNKKSRALSPLGYIERKVSQYYISTRAFYAEQ